MTIREGSGCLFSEIKIYEIQGRLWKLLAAAYSTFSFFICSHWVCVFSPFSIYMHEVAANIHYRHHPGTLPLKTIHLTERLLLRKWHFPIKGTKLFSSFIVLSEYLIRNALRVGQAA